MRHDVIGTELVLYNSTTSRWYTVKIENKEKLDLLRYGHQLGMFDKIYYKNIIDLIFIKQNQACIEDDLFIVTGGLDDHECSNQIVKLKLTL